MSRHTPGPWKSRVVNGKRCVVQSGSQCLLPGCVAVIDTDGDHPTAQADAQLIAAAPDLLNACKAMLRAFGNCGSPLQQNAADLAAQAIRNAEGDE